MTDNWKVEQGDCRDIMRTLPDNSVDAIVSDPPYGLVLDPFNGSGSTGCAAVLEGFRYIGCELEAEYVEIARRRIAYWEGQKAEPDLFG